MPDTRSTYPTREDLQRLWNLGIETLRKLEQPYGFSASEHSTGIYATLFGRDSLWTLLLLLRSLAYVPSFAFSQFVRSSGERILNSLVETQGTRIDDAVEEQPGKILHEMRRAIDDRLRRTRIPFADGKSYAGFDETFLFITALARYLDTYPEHPSKRVFVRAAAAAVQWILDYADADGDGLYEYQRRNVDNLLNQVWKDSVDSVSREGVDIPDQPVAWIEVQAYAYSALQEAARLARDHPQDFPQDGATLLSRADDLREQVDKTFWMESEGFYAMAVDGRKEPIRLLGSNAGHALWAGLAHESKVHILATRIAQPDLSTSYGLRTLSAMSDQYAPFAYHRGSVWPFDTAVVAQGLIDVAGSDTGFLLLEGLTHAIDLIGSPIEAFTVLSTSGFIEPTIPDQDVLAFRVFPPENRLQAFSAAALLYGVAVLAAQRGHTLSDA